MEKIDLVVPYVDMDDPNWQQLAKQYKIPVSICRYRSQKDFWKNFFRGIAANLPWINQVFLIVQSRSQVPNWLDTSKIKVILHEDFIPKEFLPVFSSCTIEMFIQNISELSEKFLYFNDDIFVLRPLSPEQFFKDDVVYHNFKDRYSVIRNRKLSIHGYICKNSHDLVDSSEEVICPIHGIQPLLKSKMIECYNKCKEQIFNSITPTRTTKNLNIYLYVFYINTLGLYKESTISFGYTNSYSLKLFASYPDVLCINDNSATENVYNNIFIKGFFNKLFTEKSKYEK